MPISIKNTETEELARKLVKITGETLTDAIRVSLAERYERLRQGRAKRSLVEDLHAIAMRGAGLPDISTMTDDEILGYDEFGAPTR